MMHSDLIELEAGRPSTTPSEADDVQGYAPVAAGLVHCVNAGMVLGMAAYFLWFEEKRLGDAINAGIREARANFR